MQLILSAWRKWVFTAAISGICAGCAIFRQEVPGTRYVVTPMESGSPAACEELARLFENEANLKRTPRTWPLSDGEYCEIYWSKSGTNSLAASVSWDQTSLRIWVPFHVHALKHYPSEEETQLANQLVSIVETRYPTAKVEPQKVYCYPYECP